MGFISRTRDIVRQKWKHDEDFINVRNNSIECMSEGGSIEGLSAWDGDVRVGFYQLLLFCKDNGKENGDECIEWIKPQLNLEKDYAKDLFIPANSNYIKEVLNQFWNGIDGEEF